MLRLLMIRFSTTKSPIPYRVRIFYNQDFTYATKHDIRKVKTGIDSDETHQQAIDRLQLKRGDKVKLIGKGKDFDRGFNNSWTKIMDTYVGKIGIVSSVSEYNGVYVDFNTGRLDYGYPAYTLEKIV